MQWNWKSYWREASFRRLVLAVVISFLIHLLFIGKIDLTLPSWKSDTRPLETRLVVLANQSPKNTSPENINLKNASPKNINSENIYQAQPKPVKKTTPEALPKPTVESPDAVPMHMPEPIASASESESLNSFEPSPVTPVPDQTSPPIAPVTKPDLPALPETPEVIVNADAYKYVVTEFDVRTNPDANVDSRPEGRAKITYQLLPNGEQYKLESLIEPIGLASFVIPDLLQTSEGFMSAMGLQPTQYLYQFGDKKEKTYRANMDWESAKLQLQTSKGMKEVPLTEGTQDLLSFMYQFMFIPPPQNMLLNITNGKKLDSYQYFFAGEEVIDSKMGELRTLHIYRDNDDNDERSELWLALDYQYVPVKIRKTEPENKVYELLATRINTEQPEEIKP